MWYFVTANMNDIMETIEFIMNFFQIIDNGAFLDFYENKVMDFKKRPKIHSWENWKLTPYKDS